MKPRWLVPALALAFFSAAAWGQQQTASPAGLWQTIDDRTGRERALVRVFESNGAYYGRIERIFDPAQANRICSKCPGDRREKPILGLDFMRGLRPDGEGRWSGGEILDPETGDTYRASMRLADNGDKLVVRGSVLGGLIGRSQTWIRAKSAR